MKRLVTMIYTEDKDNQCFNDLLRELNLTDYKQDVMMIKLERSFSNLTDRLTIKGQERKPWYDYECGSTTYKGTRLTCQELLKLVRLGFINSSETFCSKGKISLYLESTKIGDFLSMYYEDDHYDHQKSIEENVVKIFSV